MERDTRQRRAIRQALEGAGRPLAPGEVLAEARAAEPGLSLATVYRNLRALASDGFIVPVALPGEPDRFEVAGKGHHHHFHCRACDRVFEVEGCGGAMAAPPGFSLEGHEVLLYGLCAACSPAR
ncbi:MAG TPA: transcriptional repressor [Deinococcales bacterium]|nr:transcriptional repressor [Deinococcales bacterium]